MARLAELAQADRPEERKRLATGLCDLLLDWPEGYPHQAREPFESLLEKTLRLIDRDTRLDLVARIAAAPGAPLGFLNEYYLEAPAGLRAAILARNGERRMQAARASFDEAALVAAARAATSGDFTLPFARALSIPTATAERILADPDGEALAAAMRGAGASRAGFSTLALIACGLHAPGRTLARLSAYERISPCAAENLLHFWRTHAPLTIAA